MRRALALAALQLASSAAWGCGYRFAAGGGHLPRGAERVAVRPFANRTTESDAGALLGAALRRELARRGADGEPGAPASISGEVLELSSAPAGAGLWQLTLAVRARLAVGEREIASQQLRCTEPYASGVDPLESEGRRRIALQRAAERAARQIVERFETD